MASNKHTRLQSELRQAYDAIQQKQMGLQPKARERIEELLGGRAFTGPNTSMVYRLAIRAGIRETPTSMAERLAGARRRNRAPNAAPARNRTPNAAPARNRTPNRAPSRNRSPSVINLVSATPSPAPSRNRTPNRAPARNRTPNRAPNRAPARNRARGGDEQFKARLQAAYEALLRQGAKFRGDAIERLLAPNHVLTNSNKGKVRYYENRAGIARESRRKRPAPPPSLPETLPRQRPRKQANPRREAWFDGVAPKTGLYAQKKAPVKKAPVMKKPAKKKQKILPWEWVQQQLNAGNVERNNTTPPKYNAKKTFNDLNFLHRTSGHQLKSKYPPKHRFPGLVEMVETEEIIDNSEVNPEKNRKALANLQKVMKKMTKSRR